MFSNNVKILEHNDKVILANIDTGQWIRLSKNVYNIVRQVINEEITYNELLEALADEEDRNYIGYILKQIKEIGICANVPGKSASSKSVIFEVTNRCNLHCIHCCNNSDMITDYELSSDQLIKILDFIIKNHPNIVTITGGEPLVREDFLSFISYLRNNYSGKISLMTNGTLINSNNVLKIIQNVDEVNISIDGIDEKTTDKIRGKGVYSKVLNSIKLLQNRGFNNITLSIVLGDKNYYLQEPFLELNKRLGTKPLIRGFAESGRGKNSKSVFSTDAGIENIENIFSEANLREEHTKKLSPCACNAGRKKIFIDYKGNIYPCQFFNEKRFQMGNALEDNIQNLYLSKGAKEIEQYFPWNFKKCKNCSVNIFCWPCPGELMQKTENKTVMEEICRKMRKILYKCVWNEAISDETE